MDRETLVKALGKIALDFQMTGSRYICDPAPTGTDEDYAVLGGAYTEQKLIGMGFTCSTDPKEYVDLEEFTAWRLGEFNIIFTGDPVFYDKFVVATMEARKLNLLDKSDRVALFQEVLYGFEEIPL